MTKSITVPFEPSPEFSSNPLSEVIQTGAQKLLRTAIETEFQDFIDQHTDFLDKKGQKRLIRHGFLPERMIMTTIGMMSIQVPRVRDRGANKDGTKIKFRSSLVSQCSHKAKPIEELFSWLYLKGILTGDFSEALATLPGMDGKELPPSTINRLKVIWCKEHQDWQKQDLKNRHYTYIWADEIYFTSCLGSNHQCMLVMIGINEHGKKDVLAIMNGSRENLDNWRNMLKSLKKRGLTAPSEFSIGNVTHDFPTALHDVYTETRKQKFQVYKNISAAYTLFVKTCDMKYRKTIAGLLKICNDLLTFLAKHWEHIWTINPVRNIFAILCDRARKIRSCLNHETTLTTISRISMITRKKSRKDPAPTPFPEINQDVVSNNSLEFVAQLCQEYWKLTVATERATKQMSEKDGRRLTGRVMFSKRQLDVLMQKINLRFVDFTDELIHPGLAVVIDNPTDYKDEEELVINKTLEPTVMSDMTVIRLGRVIVEPARQEKE